LTASSGFGSLPASDNTVRIRNSQLKELKHFVTTQTQASTQWPILLSGDFSINARECTEEYESMMSVLEQFENMLPEHPITYGDIDNGEPVEHILTPKHLAGCCASVDYMFLIEGKECKMRGKAEVKKLKVKDMEFSHISGKVENV
jgi:hypothetical protein